MDGEAGLANPSDRTLLRRYRAGESDAATELYVRYAQRLQALARAQTSSSLSSRFDPEDVVQSVFRTFFRRASEGLYDVPAGAQLWQLLLVLALNKVRALAVYHRAQRRDVSRTQSDAAIEMPPLTEDETPHRILSMVVDEVMDGLPDIQQTIIRMRIEGNDVVSIAAETGRSKRTVERVLQGFRQRLSGLIDEPATPTQSVD